MSQTWEGFVELLIEIGFCRLGRRVTPQIEVPQSGQLSLLQINARVVLTGVIANRQTEEFRDSIDRWKHSIFIDIPQRREIEICQMLQFTQRGEEIIVNLQLENRELLKFLQIVQRATGDVDVVTQISQKQKLHVFIYTSQIKPSREMLFRLWPMDRSTKFVRGDNMSGLTSQKVNFVMALRRDTGRLFEPIVREVNDSLLQMDSVSRLVKQRIDCFTRGALSSTLPTRSCVRYVMLRAIA